MRLLRGCLLIIVLYLMDYVGFLLTVFISSSDYWYKIKYRMKIEKQAAVSPLKISFYIFILSLDGLC